MTKERLAAAAVFLAVIAAVTLAPGPLGQPLRRLANAGADRSDPNSPDPITTATVDVAALRRASRLIGAGTFYLNAPPSDPQLSGHDLPGVANLFLSPAVPTHDIGKADWILSYDVGPLVPPGITPSRIWRLSAGIALIEVRH